MHRFTLCLLMACTLLAIPGCGGCGGLTQEDMRRAALRRTTSRDVDEVEEEAKVEKRQSRASGEGGQGAAPADAAESTEGDSAATTAGDADLSAPSPQGQSAENLPPPVQERMPPQPLTPVERRRRTIDNLTTIGEAIRRYTAANRMFFASSIRDAGRRPLLSWRVELLPYLGHQELHRQFRLNEPWDSPHNKALLDRIPDVYLSPERCDDTTNYVVPVASFTAFGDKRGGLPLRKFEDGLANTVVLLEVNDASAVPWTKPADLELNMLTLGRHVGGLREDGYFVVWGDGSVGRIAAVTDSMAMFTYDAGEHFLAAEVSLAATAEPATEEGRETVGSDVPSDVPPDPTQGAAAREKPMVAGNSDTLAPSHVPSVLRDRMPLPDPLSLKTARDLVREIYQHDYESAKTDRDRAQLADRLLQRAEQVSGDHAGQYVLLEIAMNIATQVGHGTTALSALQKLVNRYQVDELTVSRPEPNGRYGRPGSLRAARRHGTAARSFRHGREPVPAGVGRGATAR